MVKSGEKPDLLEDIYIQQSLWISSKLGSSKTGMYVLKSLCVQLPQ